MREYLKSVWSLSCVGPCVPLLTENCDSIPPHEAAKVAWALSAPPTPNTHTFAFLSFGEPEWLQKVFTSVFWQRYCLSHWGHLEK